MQTRDQALQGAGRGRQVLVALPEHGGAGASGAAPIARALYETYFRTDPDSAAARRL